MRPIVLLTAGLVLGACSSGDQNASTTGDSAMGSVAPAGAGTGGAAGAAGAGTGGTTGGTTGSMGAMDSAASGATGAGAGTGGGAGTTGGTGTAGGTGTTGATGGTGTGGSTGSAAGTATPTGADKGNQSQSGVVDSKTGASTLGPGATKTRPDQGEATTSKGDTVAPRTPPR
jgi:hypothetical protein